MLQSKYGWTVEYIKGKWIKICPHSQECCIWGSCLERNNCESYNLELRGLTRSLFLKFVDLASDDNYQREKRLYNVLGVLISGKPIIAESNYSNRIVDVEAKKKDILYDFPYDVPYPTEKMIQDNLKYWETASEKDSLEIWNKERADAARGKIGVVAKRCSVNSLLWVEYKEGKFKDQKSLKNRLKLDHLRIVLYPRDFPRNKVCEAAPPIEYWRTLKESGKLIEYINDLKSIGFDDIESVVPLNDELKQLLEEIVQKKAIEVNKEIKEGR